MLRCSATIYTRGHGLEFFYPLESFMLICSSSTIPSEDDSSVRPAHGTNLVGPYVALARDVYCLVQGLCAQSSWSSSIRGYFPEATAGANAPRHSATPVSQQRLTTMFIDVPHHTRYKPCRQVNPSRHPALRMQFESDENCVVECLDPVIVLSSQRLKLCTLPSWLQDLLENLSRQ